MFANPRIKRTFVQLHGEIFDADYWSTLQSRIRAGRLEDVVPYLHTRRFEVR
jgi:isocitrate dehydrogenase kinase/phosphatase